MGEFWDTHSLADYWDQTEEAHVEFDPAQRRGSGGSKPMAVHKWAEIRAKKFSPEEIEAIQKCVDAELAGMEPSGDHDKNEEAQEEPAHPEVKPTLFGSVQAGDITDEMIEEAKKDLFPDLDDL